MKPAGLLAAFLSLSTVMSHAAVSDEKARMWVSSALAGSPSPNDAEAQKRINERRSSRASLAGWKLLKECRDSGQSLDLDLASAEHYLFIRAFAAEKGEQDIEALPGLYGSVKEGLGPVAQLLKTSNQPVSPPDAGVIRWGNSGVVAGLSDYKQITKKEVKPKSGTYAQYKLALEGYYANYTQTVPSPSCKVKP